MLYLTLGFTLSLANLAAPFSCICQVFDWRNVNEVILKEDTQHEDNVPKTVEEIRKLIDSLKKRDVVIKLERD